MELRQLRYFSVVAEELHFRRAAQRLHISQPPLSQQIRQLEEELGVKLLERNNRNVELTEAGRVFWEHAAEVLQGVGKAAQAARSAAKGETGCLRIGFVAPAMDGALPEIIREYKQRRPGVVLELLELGSTEQLARLRAGMLDVGFLRAHQRKGAPNVLDEREFHVQLFSRQPHVLAIPQGRPLAKKQEIALSDLAETPLVLFPRRVQPGLYDALMDCFANEQVRVNIAQEVIGARTAIALVQAGLGVAVVPGADARESRNGVAFRPVAPALPAVEILRVSSKTRSAPPLKLFEDIIKKRQAAEEEYEEGRAAGSTG